MYQMLKSSVFLLLPLLTLAETYYEVRASNGETTLQPASAVGNLEHVPQQQQPPQQLLGSQQQSQAPAPANNGFRPFGSFSLDTPSFFGLGESAYTFPFLGGALIGICLVYFWQYLIGGWGKKLLTKKFYGFDEEEVDEPENGDLKKESATKEDKKVDEPKSRRKRNAFRLARTAGRIQRSIDDFESKY